MTRIFKLLDDKQHDSNIGMTYDEVRRGAWYPRGGGGTDYLFSGRDQPLSLLSPTASLSQY
jgi:hypothetical protein